MLDFVGLINAAHYHRQVLKWLSDNYPGLDNIDLYFGLLNQANSHH